ncbi:hypothetical protein D3C73_1513480 [compost metagenome]
MALSFPELLHGLLFTHHIAILAINVEQVGFVWCGVPIADAFANNNGSESMLHGIYRRRANTATG